MKNKGEYGYLKSQRIKNLVLALGFVIVLIVLIIVGINIYNNKKNIYTVIAAVMAIPTAKFIVGFIILIPLKSLSTEDYNSIKSLKDNVKTGYDYGLVLNDKTISFPCISVKDNRVYGYCVNKNINNSEAEKLILDVLKKDCKVDGVKVYKDFSDYYSMVLKVKNNNEGKFDEKIEKTLKIYAV